MIKKIAIGIPIVLVGLLIAYIAIQTISVVHLKSSLVKAPGDYTYGNPDGDLKVVEFVSYTCPYCRNLHPVLMDAIDRDDNVLYIPRPLPSRVDDAVLAYAAGEQDLFHLAHGALLKDPRILDEGGIMAIAETLGLDMEKLKQDMESDVVKQHIQSNIDAFLGMGFESTPTYVIGDNITFVPRDQMPTADDFLKLFEQARNK